jgi:hypothetical protein
VIDKSKRDAGTFTREDFTFDKERNVYTCLAGKLLTTTGRLVDDGETLLYFASVLDCRSCLLRARCCPKRLPRRIPRSIYEEARDVARALAKTKAFEQSRRDRKRVEMLFAHLKRILRLGRLRLRGPRGAQFEFTLAVSHKTFAGSQGWSRGLRRSRQLRASCESRVSFVASLLSSIPSVAGLRCRRRDRSKMSNSARADPCLAHQLLSQQNLPQADIALAEGDDIRLAPKIAAVKETWPEFDRTIPLVVLFPGDGLWTARCKKADGSEQELSYKKSSGLGFG